MTAPENLQWNQEQEQFESDTKTTTYRTRTLGFQIYIAQLWQMTIAMVEIEQNGEKNTRTYTQEETGQSSSRTPNTTK